jgi:hypothetical protein
MMATLRRFMGSFFQPCNGERDLAGMAGTSGTSLKPEIRKGAIRPKKEARPKGPGKPLRVAPQYIQKTPKNNGLFDIWLAEFGTYPGLCGS